MEKSQIVSEIGRLEGEIARNEAALVIARQQLETVNRNRNYGGIAILIGLVLLLILWFVGVPILIVGLLTYFTAVSKRSGTQAQVDALSDAIAKGREQKARLSAQLAAG